MSKTLLRKTLSAPGLLGSVRGRFERVDDPVGNPRASLADSLMSGLLVFGIKHCSLLKFEEGVRCDGSVRGNLCRLYRVRQVLADTTMRERLDRMDPSELRGAFKAVLSALQRGKGLDGFAWLGGLDAKALDGAAFKAVRKRYWTILTQAKGELPRTPARVDGRRGRVAKSDAQNLHEALTKREDEALRFARDPDVHFTNNRAERDI